MNLPEAPTGIGRVCIDLDGTLAEGQWPSPGIGPAIEKGVNILLTCEELGYEVVIFTARPQSHQERIWQWLRQEGLDDAVYDVVCGKPQAQLYVDDKAYNPFTADIATLQYDLEEGAAPPASAQGNDVVESGPPSSIRLFTPEYEADLRRSLHLDEDEPDDGWIHRMLKGVWG